MARSKLLIYLGVLLGGVAWAFASKLAALYFFIAVTAGIALVMARKAAKGERIFLITLVILIFVSRLILSIAFTNVRGGLLSQDEGLYSKKALLKVLESRNVPNLEGYLGDFFNDPDMVNTIYGYNAYTYTLAAFYRVFGYGVQGARLISTLFNILTFLLIFYIAKELFDLRVARVASSAYAFFPSLALWSVMIGVDSMGLFFIAMCIYAIMKISKETSPVWLAATFFSILVVKEIRTYIAGILLLVASAVISFRIFSKLTIRARGALVLSGLLIITMAHAPIARFFEDKYQDVTRALIKGQGGFAVADDSGYLLYPAHCYKTASCTVPELLGAYSKGMLYVLFSPFPWRIDSRLQLMAYPQTIIWYFLIPFVLYGLYLAFRRRPLQAYIVSAYILLILSLLALVEGNIGSLFRHKDMATPFLLIFAAGGLTALFFKDRKI